MLEEVDGNPVGRTPQDFLIVGCLYSKTGIVLNRSGLSPAGVVSKPESIATVICGVEQVS